MNKPGWYPDPENAGALRWWDGARWSLPVDIGSDPVIDLRAPHAVQAGRPDPLFGCAPLPIENAPVKVDLAPIESTLAAPTPMTPSSLQGQLWLERRRCLATATPQNR